MKPSPDSALVCFSFVDEIQEEKLLDEYRSMLPKDELETLGRFRFARHRRRYLVGRALLRTTLAKYVGSAPDLLRFSREPHGRPVLSSPQRQADIQFNLSYTEGLVGVVLIRGKKAGLDVEQITTRVDCLDIARSYFCRAEYEELRNMTGPGRKSRFYEFWTLKEAYLKAQGLGLNLALDEVCFASSERSQKPAFILHRDDCSFQFRLLNPSLTHKAAICIGVGSGEDISVICKKAVPLAEEVDLPMPVD